MVHNTDIHHAVTDIVSSVSAISAALTRLEQRYDEADRRQDSRADTVAHSLDDISTRLDRLEHDLNDTREASWALRHDITTALENRRWAPRHIPWNAA